MERGENKTGRPRGDIFYHLIAFIQWLGDFIHRNPDMDADGTLSDVRKSLIKKAAQAARKKFDDDAGGMQYGMFFPTQAPLAGLSY